MADGFIVRRGGKAADQTATPSILDFSAVSGTEIKFKLRNNDAETATLVYRFGTVTGDGDSISVAASTTTSEITLTVPTITAPTKLFVTANAVGKIKSEVAEEEFEVPIIYTAATGGTTNEYDDGGKRYKSHTFTSNGTFEVTTVGNGDRNQVDILLVGGGGGGGAAGISNAGGGGAGGFVLAQPTISQQSYSINVGSGGNGGFGTGVDRQGLNGTNTTGLGFTAEGGGGGGGALTSPDARRNGLNGGSGGGASTANDGTPGLATQPGTNTTAITDAGNDGGTGGDGGSGGGGAGGNTTNGFGGAGLSSDINGTSTFYAGGGSGLDYPSGTAPSGSTVGANAGAANSGSGGSGGAISSGFSGGSGIVIIRYEIAPSV